VLPPEPAVTQLTCSPCKKIAFTSSRDGNKEIYTIGADGTGLARLTSDVASDDEAAWSPDGKRIAFTSRAVGDDPDLLVMNEDGTGVVRLALPHRFVSSPTWSVDGTKITYSALSDGSSNIWAVDADGGWPALLYSAPGWDDHPSWSPDGRKIVLASDWFAYDTAYDVFVIDPDGSGLKPLTDGNIFDRLDYVRPTWSPDGSKIAVTMIREIGIDQFLAWISVMNSDGSGFRPLIAAAPRLADVTWSKISWSPDGTMIAFTSRIAQTDDVSWITADGGAWGTIVTNAWNPAWQP
jgi:Tol biopolymer transport system component